MAVDYVCGMHVDEKKTEFSLEHKGKIYYFCSPSCLEAFEKDHEAYIEKRRDPWQHVGKQSCC
jgi:YHS domain-containing protein